MRKVRYNLDGAVISLYIERQKRHQGYPEGAIIDGHGYGGDN